MKNYQLRSALAIITSLDGTVSIDSAGIVSFKQKVGCIIISNHFCSTFLPTVLTAGALKHNQHCRRIS
jgi:hypothetical protein